MSSILHPVRRCLHAGFGRPSRRRALLAAGAALLMFSGSTFLLSRPASAIANGSAVSTTSGFDRCSLPSVAQMQQWWNGSPYYWYGVYIGGSEASCPPGNIASWLNQVHSQGWMFEYIWVGPQAPCTSGYGHTFSSDPASAKGQGRTQASAAYQQLSNDGITVPLTSTPVVYDLESAGNGTCQTAINAFMQGWVNYLRAPPAQIPGVYGSACGSNLVALTALNPPPSFIWGAYYDNNPNTADLNAGGCGPRSGDWVNHQRLKQYDSDVSEKYGGVPLVVDQDCANAVTTPSGSRIINCN